MQQLKQQRQLGVWESGFRSAHDMLHGSMLVVSRASFIGAYQLNKIKQAFELLFQQHPLLSAVIEVKGYNAFFMLNANFADIPFQEMNVKYDRQAQFDAEIHHPLQSDQYLWRVTIAKTDSGFDLFLTTHHAIADALSAVSLLDQFMQIYSQLLKNDCPKLKNHDFLANVENYLKESLNWQEFTRNYQTLDQAAIDKIPYEKIAPVPERKSNSVFMKIHRTQLALLLEKCKQNNITLNSLLNAVMLMTQAHLNPQCQTASLKTPVNLRNYCEPTIEKTHIGCFMSIVETVHKNLSKQNDLWKLARSFQEDLSSSIPKIGFLPRQMDFAEIDMTLVTQLFGVGNAKRRTFLPNTFGVSNIGRIEMRAEYPQFELTEFVFSTNHLLSNYYMFLSALTFQDELNLIFSYVTPLISTEKAARFISVFMEQLNAIHT